MLFLFLFKYIFLIFIFINFFFGLIFCTNKGLAGKIQTSTSCCTSNYNTSCQLIVSEEGYNKTCLK